VWGELWVREWRGFKAGCEAVGAVKEGSDGRCRA
jgi:hypothetical protein